jgi:hypothetical protein
MRTKEAVALFGGVKQMADALGIWPQAIYAWGNTVPELRQYQIREILREREAQKAKEQEK